ncbi:MAG: cytochrome c [Anaerolineae bacterium]
MRKILKWLGFILAGIVVVILLAAAAAYMMTESRLNRTYNVQPEALAIPSDAEAVKRGEHIAIAIAKCVDCHGKNLAGSVMIDDPAIGRLSGSNLTKGQGGVGSSYTDADWIRAIRHGVGPDGKPLWFMTSQLFYYFSDQDLADVIAYVKSVPAVDNEPLPNQVGPIGRLLFISGELELTPAEKIDHTGPRPVAPEPGITADYGRYLAVTGGCIDCHGPGLSGGHVPGTPPNDPKFPDAANITPAGEVGQWSEEDFIKAMRTGQRPDGTQIDPFMPWPYVGQMTDDELKAVWAYLQTVPAKPTGTR